METEKSQTLKYLSKYCPSLVSLVSWRSEKWMDLDTKLNNRAEEQISRFSERGEFGFEITLWDLIARVEIGEHSKDFLGFIEQICKDVLINVPKAFLTKKKVRKSARDLVENFSTFHSDYLNPIGEFVALLSLLKNSSFQLKDVEYKLPNGMGVDYYLIHSQSSAEYLVDVVNIHLDRKVNNESDLVSRLSAKIGDKLNDKGKNLSLSSLDKPFKLLPVIWCDFEKVSQFASIFRATELQYKTLPICVIGQIVKENGSHGYIFSTVDRQLESYNKQRSNIE